MAKAPTETRLKVVDPVDKELAALGTVCRELAEVQPDTRRRMLEFLKSKFSSEWPRDPEY
jgi:hypothetical protein